MTSNMQCAKASTRLVGARDSNSCLPSQWSSRLRLIARFSLLQLSTVNLTFGEPFRNAEWVGLENYQWLLTNEFSTFWATVRVTVRYLLGTLIPELLIGFAIALLLNRKMRGNSLFTAVLIIPVVLMPSMVGLIGRLYFSYDGLINYFFEVFTGIRHNWYGKDLALVAVILVDIWEWTPFFILILLAGLQTLPVEPFEAARVDGASRWQSFIHLTLPLDAALGIDDANLALHGCLALV